MPLFTRQERLNNIDIVYKMITHLPLRLITSLSCTCSQYFLYFLLFLLLFYMDIYRMKIIIDVPEEFWNACVPFPRVAINNSRCVFLISFHLKSIEKLSSNSFEFIWFSLFTLIDSPHRYVRCIRRNNDKI